MNSSHGPRPKPSRTPTFLVQSVSERRSRPFTYARRRATPGATCRSRRGSACVVEDFRLSDAEDVDELLDGGGALLQRDALVGRQVDLDDLLESARAELA